MSEVVTILADTKVAAYGVLRANYPPNVVVRVASYHDTFEYISVPPVVSSVDHNMPTGRLDNFTAINPPQPPEKMFVLVAISP